MPTPSRFRRRGASALESKRRLQEGLWAEMRANEEYLAYRARGVMSNARRLGPSTGPKPVGGAGHADGQDQRQRPDSRNVKTPRGYLQGDNAEAVCNEQPIVRRSPATHRTSGTCSR